MRKEKTIQYFAYLSNSCLFLGFLWSPFSFIQLHKGLSCQRCFLTIIAGEEVYMICDIENDNKVSSALVIFSVWRQFEITAQLAS